MFLFIFQEFIEKKYRLRIENTTRWSSAFLMLEAVKRAYDRQAFSDENPCPVDLETIEIYLQILAPACRVSVG